MSKKNCFCRCERAITTIICGHEPYCNNGAGCSEHGSCVNGTCICAYGFAGDACDIKLCNSGDGCEQHGTCVDGACLCDTSFAGAACEIQLCNSGTGCGRFGSCENGTCVCDELYVGDACDTKLCNGGAGCGEHGTCVDGECLCDEAHAGRHCEIILCNNGSGCGENGACLRNGTCRCYEHWRGAACDEAIAAVAMVAAIWKLGLCHSFALTQPMIAACSRRSCRLDCSHRHHAEHRAAEAGHATRGQWACRHADTSLWRVRASLELHDMLCISSPTSSRAGPRYSKLAARETD